MSARDDLVDVGVPVAPIKQMVAQSFAGVEAAVSAALWCKEHPDLAATLPEMERLLARDPSFAGSVERVARVDPDMALEMAALRCRHDEAKRAGGGSFVPPTPPPPPAPTYGGPAGDPVERLRRLQTSSGRRAAVEAYAKQRLGQVISDEFLNE